MEISVRNLLGNPGLGRNYVGRVAQGESSVALENIFKLAKRWRSSRDLFVAALTIWVAIVSLSGIQVVTVCSGIRCSALRRRASRNWLNGNK